ncbi:MAG: leucyl aminopeptidase family protein [Betaproteobacteria bacterium]|nr:leucyl aminopeptidase family protein [Betaproteobacteria bacterium]
MLAALRTHAKPLDDDLLARHAHALVVLPAGADAEIMATLPQKARLRQALKRRAVKPGELAKSPVAIQTDHGGLCAYVMIDRARPRFEQLATLRKALTSLLEEKPRGIAIGVFGDEALRTALAREAVYVAWLNGVRLPVSRKKPQPRSLERLEVFGVPPSALFEDVAVLARANTLARELTVLPTNTLTPASYRARLRELAVQRGWGIEEYDFERLSQMGAGAFTAVAQGSPERDAAIVHLRYEPRNAPLSVALVGKGICFDTGGHNLKPARYMSGMHEDMNGSAVAVGLLQALAEQGFPLRVDAWLAISRNDISPQAYRQNDVVRALDGTTVEIVHTDAEGRLVLADALTLAVREGPNLVMDFATLTGSMHSALGSRYSGVFASAPPLGQLALEAGDASAERVCLFPMDEDYEEGLESRVADVKQCAEEGEADHILAARFLQRFTKDLPWLHMDLSASSHKGGLGAVGSDVTGFGVAWGVELLRRWLDARPATVTAKLRKGRAAKG